MEDKKQNSRSGGIPGMSFNAPVTFNAPMFDIHDNTNVYINTGEGGGQETKGRERVRVPELSTPEAHALLDKFVEAGILDTDFQPLNLSIAERGVLASFLANELGITNLWQAFGGLWGMKAETLRTGNSKAQEQNKTGRFMDRIKLIIINHSQGV